MAVFLCGKDARCTNPVGRIVNSGNIAFEKVIEGG
jgi:hypothetical protein